MEIHQIAYSYQYYSQHRAASNKKAAFQGILWSYYFFRHIPIIKADYRLAMTIENTYRVSITLVKRCVISSIVPMPLTL